MTITIKRRSKISRWSKILGKDTAVFHMVIREIFRHGKKAQKSMKLYMWYACLWLWKWYILMTGLWLIFIQHIVYKLWSLFLTWTYFTESFKLCPCLHEVSCPIGQVKYSKYQRKQISWDYVNTFWSVRRDPATSTATPPSQPSSPVLLLDLDGLHLRILRPRVEGGVLQ